MKSDLGQQSDQPRAAGLRQGQRVQPGVQRFNLAQRAAQHRARERHEDIQRRLGQRGGIARQAIVRHLEQVPVPGNRTHGLLREIVRPRARRAEAVGHRLHTAHLQLAQVAAQPAKRATQQLRPLPHHINSGIDVRIAKVDLACQPAKRADQRRDPGFGIAEIAFHGGQKLPQIAQHGQRRTIVQQLLQFLVLQRDRDQPPRVHHDRHVNGIEIVQQAHGAYPRVRRLRVRVRKWALWTVGGAANSRAWSVHTLCMVRASVMCRV